MAPWADYLKAANRKIEIAGYHLQRLLPLLDASPGEDENGFPPLCVQAHFEGVLFSILAAANQVEEAIKRARKLNEKCRRCTIRAVSISRLEDWFFCPLVDDLRWVRNRATHAYYDKTRNGGRWFVQRRRGKAPYEGSREIGDYCRSAVDQGRQLVALMPEVQSVLGSDARQHGATIRHS
jgi:hypothetical protein